jgi:hypothetical protein
MGLENTGHGSAAEQGHATLEMAMGTRDPILDGDLLY